MVIDGQFCLLDKDVIKITALFTDEVLEIVLELELQVSFSLEWCSKAQLKHL